MHKLFLSALICLAGTSLVLGQSATKALPAATPLEHYFLSVGYSTTTVLIFPAAVKSVDRGDRAVLAQKQPGVENVLKLKAARRDFSSTNLHVFTSDGRVYGFDLHYIDSPAQTTYDLRGLDMVSLEQHRNLTPIVFTSPLPDPQQWAAWADSVKRARPFFSLRVRKDKITFGVLALYQQDGFLLFQFRVANRSTLPYVPESLTVSIRDLQRLRRASQQAQELIPTYADTLGTVPGHSAVQWVVVLPMFTLPGSLVLDLYERNGGRQLTLLMKNHHLFKARTF